MQADVIILTTHMGDPEDEAFLYYLSPLLNRDNGIDVVIAGHTHNTYITNYRGRSAFGSGKGEICGMKVSEIACVCVCLRMTLDTQGRLSLKRERSVKIWGF